MLPSSKRPDRSCSVNPLGLVSVWRPRKCGDLGQRLAEEVEVDAILAGDVGQDRVVGEVQAPLRCRLRERGCLRPIGPHRPERGAQVFVSNRKPRGEVARLPHAREHDRVRPHDRPPPKLDVVERGVGTGR